MTDGRLHPIERTTKIEGASEGVGKPIVSSLEIVAIVAFGTLALGYTIVRGPRPDPKLAAESPWKIVGEVVRLMVGVSLWSLLLISVPREVGITLAVGSTALAVAAGTQWHRRRARRAAGPDRPGLDQSGSAAERAPCRAGSPPCP